MLSSSSLIWLIKTAPLSFAVAYSCRLPFFRRSPPFSLDLLLFSLRLSPPSSSVLTPFAAFAASVSPLPFYSSSFSYLTLPFIFFFSVCFWCCVGFKSWLSHFRHPYANVRLECLLLIPIRERRVLKDFLLPFRHLLLAFSMNFYVTVCMYVYICIHNVDSSSSSSTISFFVFICVFMCAFFYNSVSF